MNGKKRIIFLLFIFSGVLLFLFGFLKFHKHIITSETFALAGSEPKHFMYRPWSILPVYRYEPDGSIIEYKKGKDYTINFFDGTICRTTDSRILDFDDHNVIYNEDGSFSFSDEPRNPQLNIDYQVLVDYETLLFPGKMVNCKPGLNDTVRKLKRGQDITVLLCGDSIAAGAQTTGLYYFNDSTKTTFLGLLDKFIESEYDINCNAVLLAKEGTSSYYMIEHIEDIVEQKPDVVLIEFGMNDHTGLVDEDILYGAGCFKERISNCVDRLRSENIDVVLIGFFQQNDKWDMENPEATILFNQQIKDVADEFRVPYVDI